MSDTSSCRPVPARTALRRFVALLLAALASVVVAAPPAAADARPHRLTSAQERVVLRLIDNACGDTWCEGDSAFRFRRFSCHSYRGGCVLVAQIASWSQEPLRWRWRGHRIRGFARYSDMVTPGPAGVRALRPAFLEAVGDAVRAMEATVPVSGSRC